MTRRITLPREFVALLGAPSQASETAREYIILGLFQQARISVGKAAELLGPNRCGFVALLARKGIPHLRLESEEWDAVVARIRASHQSPRPFGLKSWANRPCRRCKRPSLKVG